MIYVAARYNLLVYHLNVHLNVFSLKVVVDTHMHIFDILRYFVDLCPFLREIERYFYADFFSPRDSELIVVRPTRVTKGTCRD